jgi:hypothetical protein
MALGYGKEVLPVAAAGGLLERAAAEGPWGSCW